MKGLLLCIGGLSTSLIARRMTELHGAAGDTFVAGSILTGDWMADMNEYDVFIISPQTAFRYAEVAKEVAEYGRGQPVYQIQPNEYLPSKAEEIYAHVKALFAR